MHLVGFCVEVWVCMFVVGFCFPCICCFVDLVFSEFHVGAMFAFGCCRFAFALACVSAACFFCVDIVGFVLIYAVFGCDRAIVSDACLVSMHSWMVFVVLRRSCLSSLTFVECFFVLYV